MGMVMSVSDSDCEEVLLKLMGNGWAGVTSEDFREGLKLKKVVRKLRKSGVEIDAVRLSMRNDRNSSWRYRLRHSSD